MSSPTDIDRRHLARAIELAEGGRGRVSPNPLVGAVIGRQDEVLGEGFHQALGAPHAEVEAIRAAGGRDLDGATLYVSLEPCCHQGRTPPCTDAIRECRDRAAGRRLRRSERARLRPRPGHPARRGHRGRDRRRRARRPRPPAQPVVSQARPHRAAVGAVQVRDDARRQGRHARRRLEVDLGRGEPPAGAPVAVSVRCGRGRDRHRARRRSPADRADRRRDPPAAPGRVRLARAASAGLEAGPAAPARSR